MIVGVGDDQMRLNIESIMDCHSSDDDIEQNTPVDTSSLMEIEMRKHLDYPVFGTGGDDMQDEHTIGTGGDNVQDEHTVDIENEFHSLNDGSGETQGWV